MRTTSFMILLITLFAAVIQASADEGDQKPTITIVQLKKYKYEFYHNERPLSYKKDVLEVLNGYPTLTKDFSKAQRGYAAGNVMLGLGTGNAVVSPIVLIASLIVYYSSPTSSAETSTAVGLALGSGINTLMGIGIILGGVAIRRHFIEKKVMILRRYNGILGQTTPDSTTGPVTTLFDPGITFDTNLTPRIDLAWKVSI